MKKILSISIHLVISEAEKYFKMFIYFLFLWLSWLYPSHIFSFRGFSSFSFCKWSMAIRNSCSLSSMQHYLFPQMVVLFLLGNGFLYSFCHTEVFLLFVFLIFMWWNLSVFCRFLVSCHHRRGFPCSHKRDFFPWYPCCFFFLSSLLYFVILISNISGTYCDVRGEGESLLYCYFILRWLLVVSISFIE